MKKDEKLIINNVEELLNITLFISKSDYYLLLLIAAFKNCSLDVLKRKNDLIIKSTRLSKSFNDEFRIINKKINDKLI